MISTLAEAIKQFEDLAEESKAKVLGRLSYDLTVRSRELFLDDEVDPARMKKLNAINEIQHMALGQLLAYQTKRQQRYPDKDIIIILMKRAKTDDVLGSFQNALLGAIESYM